MTDTFSSNILANIATYQTGEGSPVSEVSVVDINIRYPGQISQTLNQKPALSGFTRLYRSIRSEYEPNKGQNCFSENINTALAYAGDADNAKMIVIDVPTATLDDLRAYERLHSAIGASFDVLGRVTGHVVDIPHDWTNGQTPNAEILRDMKGLGERLSTLESSNADTTLDIFRRKGEIENRVATEYFKEHGRGITPDWSAIFREHPDLQNIAREFEELDKAEKKQLVKLAEELPTLREAPKVSGAHINSVGAVKASAAGLVGALPAVIETYKAASEQEDAVSAGTIIAENTLEFLTGASAAIAADVYLIPMLSNPYGAAAVLTGEVLAGVAGSQVAKFAMDKLQEGWQLAAVEPLREQSETRAQEKAQHLAQETQAREQHKQAQRDANPEYYATLDQIPDKPPAEKMLSSADANAMLERLIAENGLKNGWSPMSIKDAIHVGTNHLNSNSSEQTQPLVAATTPQDTEFAMK